MSKAVRDGLYLVYVKNGMVYPIGMTLDQWQILQALGNSLAGNPIQVFPEPMGKAENLACNVAFLIEMQQEVTAK